MLNLTYARFHLTRCPNEIAHLSRSHAAHEFIFRFAFVFVIVNSSWNICLHREVIWKVPNVKHWMCYVYSFWKFFQISTFARYICYPLFLFDHSLFYLLLLYFLCMFLFTQSRQNDFHFIYLSASSTYGK